MSFNFGCGREVPEVDEALRQAYRRGVVTVASIGNLGCRGLRLAAGHWARTRSASAAAPQGGCLGAYSLTGRDVDLVAPGGGPPLPGCPSVSIGPIYQVTLLVGTAPGASASPADYVGTSMAAAHVSGVAAMVLASGTVPRVPKPSAGPHPLPNGCA